MAGSALLVLNWVALDSVTVVWHCSIVAGKKAPLVVSDCCCFHTCASPWTEMKRGGAGLTISPAPAYGICWS